MRAVLLALLIGCGDNGKTPVDAAADAGDTTCASCDPATEYCYRRLAGVLPVQGCNPLPAQCTTCACVSPVAQPACEAPVFCQVTNGLVEVDCALP